MKNLKKSTMVDENLKDENRVFSRKCKLHPSYPLDILYIKEKQDNNLLCFNCAKQKNLLLSEIHNIRELFNETSFLFRYPPLKNKTLYQELVSLNLDQSLKDIEEYFKNLKEKIKKELEIALQRAKSNYIKFQDHSKKVFEQYMILAEPEKLKELITSQSASASKDLSDFINEKWAKAQENSTILQNSLEDQYQKCGGVSFDVPNKMSQNIIESIGKIDFFKKYGSFIERASFIKSTYQQSETALIFTQKDQKQQLEVRQILESQQFNQIFLDPLLDPLQNYVIQLEIDNKQPNYKFYFGIVPDSTKDSCAIDEDMCYNDQQDDFGMIKIIKGDMWEKNRPTKRSYELRINIKTQYLRIATLPDYSSIVELDDPKKIDSKIPYRLFISMKQDRNATKITKLETVPYFDNKMS